MIPSKWMRLNVVAKWTILRWFSCAQELIWRVLLSFPSFLEFYPSIWQCRNSSHWIIVLDDWNRLIKWFNLNYFYELKTMQLFHLVFWLSSPAFKRWRASLIVSVQRAQAITVKRNDDEVMLSPFCWQVWNANDVGALGPVFIRHKVTKTHVFRSVEHPICFESVRVVFKNGVRGFVWNRKIC